MNEDTIENVKGIMTYVTAPDLGNVVHAFGQFVAIFTNF